jgi:hypothetical protein
MGGRRSSTFSPGMYGPMPGVYGLNCLGRRSSTFSLSGRSANQRSQQTDHLPARSVRMLG